MKVKRNLYIHIKFFDSSIDAVFDEQGSYIDGCILEHCLIQYGGIEDGSVIFCTNASPFINNNIIRHNGIKTWGNLATISCHHSSSIISNNTLIYNNSWSGGITYSDSSFPMIIHNTIVGNGGWTAIKSLFNSNSIIRDNNIYGQDGYGIYCERDSVIISKNIIWDNADAAICCDETFALIDSNIIRFNYGAFDIWDNSSINFLSNIVRNNGTKGVGGVGRISSSKVIMRWNHIVDNEDGIIIHNSSTIQINYNNFVNHVAPRGHYEIYLLESNEDIDATNNWWGTTNRDSIDARIWDYYDDMALGEVLYNPFLTSPYEGIGEDNISRIAVGFSLSQNYPNPFNPTTEIRYSLPRDCYVRLEVYSILGQRVAMLVEGRQTAGYKSVRWDASGVASGIYFYRLRAGSFVETRRMVVIK